MTLTASESSAVPGPVAADRAVKRERVLALLDRRGVDSIVLRSQTAVAWYLDGARTHVSLAADPVAAVVVRRAHRRHGFDPEEWRRHHQGGAAGYAGRDPRGTSHVADRVQVDQAFAWNPTAPGAKVEDTVLVRTSGIEVLTADPRWPTAQVNGIDRPIELDPCTIGITLSRSEEPAMAAIRLDEHPDRLRLRVGELVLAEYVHRPADVRLESPRPYFSPVRTLGGELVSLFRPHDHVWHKGITWSLPVVGDENFWGGPTFVRGEGYVQLPNNGEQRHVSFETVGSDASGEGVRVVEMLDWVTEAGETMFEEQRTIAASAIADDAWLLAFATRMRNVSGRGIAIGSPTTRGRENAGYGGLFWRGPRSFTGGSVLAPGVSGGDELRGIRAPWMGFSGRHDGDGGASTVVMVDDPGNLEHPPQWFARSEEFGCLCPAPFFSQEHTVAPGATLTLRYGVVVADGASDPARAERLADAGAARLAALTGAA